MPQVTNEELAELWALSNRDIEVKQMIAVVCTAEQCSLGELAVNKPEIFIALYDECYSMIAQLGEDDI